MRLAAEVGAETRAGEPLTSDETALADLADWGPAEDWSEWTDARGEIWFAATPGGDRPVPVMTRDRVAERIGAVVVAALTRTRRGLRSELALTPGDDGVPTECGVNLDNLHTIPRDALRRRVTTLAPARMAQACRTLRDALGC